MKLKTIEVKEILYGTNKGQYEAVATIEGGRAYPAAVTIPIPEELLAPIVQLLAQAISATMTKATAEFAAQVEAVQQGVLLEHQEDADPIDLIKEAPSE